MLRYVSDNVQNENVPQCLKGLGFVAVENVVTIAGFPRVAIRNLKC